MLRLIQNSSGSSHLSRIRVLSESAVKVLVTSPFLAPDLGRLAARLDIHKLEEFRLITVLPKEPYARRNALSSLVSLLKFQDKLGGPNKLRLEHAPRLHGKAYVFFQLDGTRTTIVTSANLSSHGLSNIFSVKVARSSNAFHE